MGIAHNDISLSNLMCTKRNGHCVGILNDFDLAGFMKPGARNPEKKGWERTGSIAFMAMDVLKYPDGEQRRWYRHDLESFVWCLLWVMMKEPPLSWLDDGFEEVRKQKDYLCADIINVKRSIKSEWSFASEFVREWTQKLGESNRARDQIAYRFLFGKDSSLGKNEIDIYDSEDERLEDCEHIRLVSNSAKEMDGVVDMQALYDTSWVDVVLDNLEK